MSEQTFDKKTGTWMEYDPVSGCVIEMGAKHPYSGIPIAKLEGCNHPAHYCTLVCIDMVRDITQAEATPLGMVVREMSPTEVTAKLKCMICGAIIEISSENPDREYLRIKERVG